MTSSATFLGTTFDAPNPVTYRGSTLIKSLQVSRWHDTFSFHLISAHAQHIHTPARPLDTPRTTETPHPPALLHAQPTRAQQRNNSTSLLLPLEPRLLLPDIPPKPTHPPPQPLRPRHHSQLSPHQRLHRSLDSASQLTLCTSWLEHVLRW